MRFRIERDSLGEVKVPMDAYYGAHTQRSKENFSISGRKWHPLLLRSMIIIKLACCRANASLGLLGERKAGAIEQACRELLAGKFRDQFILDIFQAGSGTSTNMNINEVIATRSGEILGTRIGSQGIVHPNDDVNKGQSTNDVVPTSMKMASLRALDALEQELLFLEKALRNKGKEFSEILKSGRTHLQDAVPITLGQEFSAYARAIEKDILRLQTCKENLFELAIGGNAVGTGLNTHPSFRKKIIKELSFLTKRRFKEAKDGLESVQFLTDIAAFHSTLKLVAIDLNKIANDLRLLASGPTTGLNEISLPAVEPGSSIMPGKINPSILEAVNMIAHRVMGNDTTLTISCASGNLELNTHMPIIANTLMESTDILTNGIKTLRERCISGIRANEERCRHYVEHSMALATALNPLIGYDKAAQVVKEARASKKTIKDVIISKGILTEQQVRRLLDPKSLTRPNLAKRQGG